MTLSKKHIFGGIALVGLVFLLAVVLLLWKIGFFVSSTDEEMPLVFQGMALHSALWRYDADHGRLPGQLSDLVPKYLKEEELKAPAPHSGGPMFRLVHPERATSERRMNGDLLVSIPVHSAGRKDPRLVYVQEDGDVMIREVPE